MVRQMRSGIRDWRDINVNKGLVIRMAYWSEYVERDEIGRPLYRWWQCSECGKQIESEEQIGYEYCPFCRARMDGDEYDEY